MVLNPLPKEYRFTLPDNTIGDHATTDADKLINKAILNTKCILGPVRFTHHQLLQTEIAVAPVLLETSVEPLLPSCIETTVLA